jgi:hypothetical protein
MEQQEFLEKLFNTLIKNRLNYNPVTNIEINICDINSHIGKWNVNKVQLKKDSYLGMEVRKCLRNLYGVTEDESDTLWDMIRIHLKKLIFVENAYEVLYDDYVQYESDPYRINGYHLKHLNDFIDFMGEIWYGDFKSDVYGDEEINFLDMLDKSEYEYIQSELFDLIESSWEPNDEYRSINEDIERYDEEEKEFNPLNDDLATKVQYEKVFKAFDSNPDKIFDLLKVFDFQNNEQGEKYEKEYNFIYKYLTEYNNRTPKYIRIVFDADDLSGMFADDRDYDIQDMVKNYLKGDWEYEPTWECMDFDSWLFDKIDESNIKTLKEHYLNNLEGEESEEDFMEFVESEFGGDIGCAASDAQYNADIDYLHSDFVESIEEYLSGFGGKLQNKVNSDGNLNMGLEYVADLEIGELTQSPFFQESLLGILEDDYPDSFYDIYNDIIESEKEGYSSEYNYFLPEDKISINTDKHFRYGGAGNIDWNYFNEILSDKLSNY